MVTLYKTWLPNASAYLSLRYIGGITHARNHEEHLRPIDSEAPNWRSFFQLRTLSERPGSNSRRHPEARYAFLFQAEIKDDTITKLSEKLEGMVYVVPESFASYLKERHSLKTDAAIKSSADLLTEIRKSAGSDAVLMAVGFCLDVDGYLTLTSQHTTTEYAEPIDATVSYGQHNVFEIYAFLRDALHKHKFHSARDDYVLEPHVVSGADDHTWIGKVARSLHRVVISGFRADDESMCDQAMGKLAYLQAFCTATEQRGLEQFLPSLGLDSLRSALHATKQEKAERAKASQQRKQMLVAAIAIFIPFFFVLLQLLQLPCIDGLNYDYKAATATQPASGNCTENKFIVSPDFLNIVAFVLQHLHAVALIGVLAALGTVLVIYRASLFPWLSSGLMEKFTTVFRYAIANQSEVLILIGTLMLSAVGLGTVALAKVFYFNPPGWAAVQWGLIMLSLSGGLWSLWRFQAIYTKFRQS
jgi:hypothetical protein